MDDGIIKDRKTSATKNIAKKQEEKEGCKRQGRTSE
jgi:hypothetical protein